jgi:cytochrome b561
MALIIISLLAVGIYMTNFLPKDSINRSTIYGLHKSFGVVVICLIIIRVINRFFHKPPSLPNSIKKLEQNLAHLAHFALYLFMFLVPLSGYLMSNSYGHAVKLFGLKLPLIIQQNFKLADIFSEIHELSAYGILALISIHILAVIKHRFFDKKENDILPRML